MIEPIKTIVKDELSSEEKEKYNLLGAELIKNSQVAVCILAGRSGDTSWS